MLNPADHRPEVEVRPDGSPTETRTQSCGKGKHDDYEATRTGWRSGTTVCWAPWPACPACHAEHEIRAALQQRAREDAEAAQHRRDLHLDSGLYSGRFREATFDAFVASTPAQCKALETCRRFADAVDLKSGWPGLVLLGKPGTGKSHLAAAIALHTIGRDFSAKFIGARAYVSEIRDTWRRDSKESDTTVLWRYVCARLLVLDDVGTGSGTDNEHALLLDLIDARYVQRRPVVVTSNLNRPELRSAIGDRAYDRLLEGAQFIVCDWASHRRPS